MPFSKMKFEFIMSESDPDQFIDPTIRKLVPIPSPLISIQAKIQFSFFLRIFDLDKDHIKFDMAHSLEDLEALIPADDNPFPGMMRIYDQWLKESELFDGFLKMFRFCLGEDPRIIFCMAEILKRCFFYFQDFFQF